MYANVGPVRNYPLSGFTQIYPTIDKLHIGGAEPEISERMGGMPESYVLRNAYKKEA